MSTKGVDSAQRSTSFLWHHPHRYREVTTGEQEYESHPLSDDLSYSNDPLHGVHRSRTGESRLKVWLNTTAPLILHFLSAIILTVVVLFYVDGHSFNLDSWRAMVTQPDGSIAPAHWSLRQSDITTAVSGGVTILRIFSAWWITATTWRCVFILMEKRGLSLHEIDTLLTWKVAPCSRSPHPNPARRVGILISTILFTSFLCQLSGPILTGSITWSPSYTHTRSRQPVTGIGRSVNGGGWYWYNLYGRYADLWRVPMSGGVASTAWHGGNDIGAMKRVLPSAEHLVVNSALDNVTLPYFAVRSIEWIRDPMTELPKEQIESVNNDSDYNPFFGQLPLTFALIPDTWESPPSDRPAFPSPVQVSETRVLVGMHGRGSTRDNVSCGEVSVFGKIPENIGFYEEPSGTDINCFIYARVSYDAGVAECVKCRLSSRLTVQNDTALAVQPDPMTMDALAFMPMVALQMTYMNTSLPGTFNNLDQYVTELLVRSYGVAWTMINDDVSNDPGDLPGKLSTGVQIAVLVSRANVLRQRVFLWLSLNIAFTLSGILFIVVQRSCDQPLIVQPSIAALLLDTTPALNRGDRSFCNFSMLVDDDKGMGYLKLRQRHNCRTVEVTT